MNNRSSLAAGFGWLLALIASGLAFGPFFDVAFPNARPYFWELGGSPFHMGLVGFSLLMAGAALLTALTRRQDDVWSAMRSSKKRTAKLSIVWSGVSMLVLGFPIWDAYVTPDSAALGKGFWVFMAMMLLGSAYSVAQLLAVARPRLG